jgi:hypothetical protein
MDVIGHETEHVHADIVCVGAVGQSQQEPLAVMVVGEDFHPPVTSMGDVIYRTGVFNSQHSSHAFKLAKTRSQRQSLFFNIRSDPEHSQTKTLTA